MLDIYHAARAHVLCDLDRADDAAKAARDLVKKFEGKSRSTALAATALMRIAEDIDDAKKRGKAYEEVITLAGKAADVPGATDGERAAALVLKAFGLHRIGKEEPALKVLQPVLEKAGRAAPADADGWKSLLSDLGPKLPDA